MVQDTPYHQSVVRENRTIPSHSKRPIGSFEQKIPIHPDIEPVPDRDFDRRLHVQIAPGDVSPEPRELSPDGASGCLPRRRIPQDSAPVGLREPERRTETARQDGKTEQPTLMVVHILPEASPSLRVLSGHAFEVD